METSTAYALTESFAPVSNSELRITRELLDSYEPPTSIWGRAYRSLDAWLSRLSTRNQFWHRAFAWMFLPLAYRSGIRLGHQNGDVYETQIPFHAFNKNWYDAMAGGALLANTEIAGGMLLFQKLGGDYTVVCKELSYRFRRPCLGPAVYRVKPLEDIEELRTRQLEFNVTMEIDILQAAARGGDKAKRVGESTAVFHVAPKALLRSRLARFGNRRAKAVKLQPGLA